MHVHEATQKQARKSSNTLSRADCMNRQNYRHEKKAIRLWTAEETSN